MIDFICLGAVKLGEAQNKRNQLHVYSRFWAYNFRFIDLLFSERHPLEEYTQS